MKLVIVESPAKCAKIQGFLGSEYEVVASMGHIRALEESLDAVGLTTDFEPRYEFLKEKSKVQALLRTAAKGKEIVYLAADDDREGEAIAYSVALLLKLPMTTPRIVFHEITEKALKAAVASPRTLHMNRIYAQQARSQLDMMIGFTLSPILWSHVARGLSAGRCQTPALKLLVEKERHIQAFKASSSWRITGQWQKANMSAAAFRFSASLEDELEDETSAQNYLEGRMTNKKAVIQTNTVKPWSSAPPEPLMTSTLQQQASALFGLSPKSTMGIAQKLYEGGHITYMRTDTTTLSQEAIEEARAWIETAYGKAYLGELKAEGTPPAPKKKTTKAKGATNDGGATKALTDGGMGGGIVAEQQSNPPPQEAHEAIRPTHMETEDVPEEYQRIYTLIRNRTLQSVMAKAVGETCSVIFHCKDEIGDDILPWKSQWKRTTFPGWQRIGKVADIEEGETEEDSEASIWTQALTLQPIGALQSNTPSGELTWTTLEAQPHETKPVPRYTEATLVRDLEGHGIGRPSTFASLLAAVQDRGYAELKDIPGREIELRTYTLKERLETKILSKKVGGEKRKLVPTDLGLQCLSFLEKHFAHLFEYRFTGQMEHRLDLIEKGLEPWKQVLRDTWASYKEKYETMKSTGGVDSKIRSFGDLKAVLTKKGPLLLKEGGTSSPHTPATQTTKTDTKFYGWPAGVLFENMTEALALEFVRYSEEVIGDWKGQPVLKKTGRFGPYVVVGTIRMSVKAEESWDMIKERLETAGTLKGPLRTMKTFEFREGPYGPYMYKMALKKRVCVSVPKDTPIQHLTDAEAEVLYKNGLEAKKKKFKKTGGGNKFPESKTRETAASGGAGLHQRNKFPQDCCDLTVAKQQSLATIRPYPLPLE